MTRRGKRAGFALAGTLALVCGWRVAAVLRDPIGPAPPGGFESLRSAAPYQTSNTCQPCHADHLSSWRRTFHSSMTRDAMPSAIVAPFDGRAIEVLGVRATPWRKGDAFFLDVSRNGTAASVTHRIDRVTGSRRMQQFETREGDRYVRLPVAWSIDERRWLHLSETFFHADGEDFDAYRAVWDLNCIFCHTTHPVPGLDAKERLASKSAELGIACEACHGPAGEHAERMRSPLRRYAIGLTHRADPTIVNPKRLDQARSVQVCGHCHGQRLPVDRNRMREILERGDPFTPGEDLSRVFTPVTSETTIGSYSFASRFWADGSPRLTAYEYQGVLASPCYLKGKMTCLSCHTMHTGDPHGQLRPDLPGNALCTQCHSRYVGTELAGHTHHREDGAGSRCLSCHMPPIVYGIMTWHPTHRVSSPDPKAAAHAGVPDACTLCHSGRSRSWAARKTSELWLRARDGSNPETEPARDEPPELVHALFSGDAVYRALSLARLGEPSPDPEVGPRVLPLLAEGLTDAYPNVRRLALLSVSRLTGRSDLPSAQDPVVLRDAARRQLEASAPRPPFVAGWPFTADGALDRPRLAEWRHERREVEVSIGE